MASLKWFKEIDNRRVDLIKEGYSYREVAIILSMEFDRKYTKNMVEYRCKSTGTTKSEINKEALEDISYDEYDSHMFPKEAYEVNEDLVFAPEKQRQLRQIWERFNDRKSKKILSLSDIHAPFANFKAIEQAIKDNGDADILILNGDVFDGHALSDFDKMNDFDIELEFKQVFMLLDVVTKKFKDVIWVGGNHDASRFMRFVAKKFGNGMKKYVAKRLNPITYIAEKYDNLIIVPHNWVEIGKCIFIHPDGYSSALMSTAMKQAEYLQANKHFLPFADFQALIQGHTHDIGSYMVNNVLIVEQGCLCFTQDYRFDRPSSRKWQTGYAVAYLDEFGNVDVNKTKWIKIGD